MKNISLQKAPFSVPELPYGHDALAPHISAETIEYHYGKHLKAYVDNLNNLVTGSGFEDATLKEILKNASGALFNNAAQVWNHTLYFRQFLPNPKTAPTSVLGATIARDFGSFEAFKEQAVALEKGGADAVCIETMSDAGRSRIPPTQASRCQTARTH